MTPSASLEIRYCQSCGYLTRALSLAATIQSTYGLAPALTPVSGGRYELWCADTLVLKRSWLAIPSEESLIQALHAHLVMEGLLG